MKISPRPGQLGLWVALLAAFLIQPALQALSLEPGSLAQASRAPSQEPQALAHASRLLSLEPGALPQASRVWSQDPQALSKASRSLLQASQSEEISAPLLQFKQMLHIKQSPSTSAMAALHQNGFVRSKDAETGACLFWPRRNIPWVLNSRAEKVEADFSEVQQALFDSFQSWEDVDCSDLSFSFAGLTPRTDVGYREGSAQNQNLLIFRPQLCRDVVPSSDKCWERPGECANRYNCWNHPSGVIALTTTNYDRNKGVIVDSDIEFNSAVLRFTTVDSPPCQTLSDTDCVAFDVANTATHEVGHMLGLDHSPDLGSAMYEMAELGETRKRELSEDDRQALCSVYPAGAAPALCTDSGYFIVSKGNSNSGCGGSATIFLLPFAFFPGRKTLLRARSQFGRFRSWQA